VLSKVLRAYFIRNGLKMSQRRLLGLAFGIFFLISGCGHTPVTRTIFDAVPSLSKQNLDSFILNPNLRYLRITVQDRSILMVRGYTEQHTAGNIDVWYSSKGEVIRLQNGRIIGTAGLETDWLNVSYLSLPSWQSLSEVSSATYYRERDQMPGYRFGIKESLAIYRTPPPSNSKMVKMVANKFRWYEEASHNTPNKLPSARFAIQNIDGVLQVAYGEQCLTDSYCLSWQLWPTP